MANTIIKPYITHIRVNVANGNFIQPIKAAYFQELAPVEWMKSRPILKDVGYCEAVCLKGFCGFEIYSSQKDAHQTVHAPSNILLFTNTKPIHVLQLNANDAIQSKATEDADGKTGGNLFADAANGIKNLAINLRGKAVEEWQGKEVIWSTNFARDLAMTYKLTARMIISDTRHVLNRMSYKQTGGGGKLRSVSSIAFDFARINIGKRDENKSATAPIPTIAPSTPSLFHSVTNPSLFSSSDTAIEKSANDRDAMWLGALAIVALTSMFLLNRCANSKSH